MASYNALHKGYARKDTAMPKKSKVSKKTVVKAKKVRRTQEQIQGLLDKIAAARSGGLTLTKALKQLGVPYNSFLNWTKKAPKPAATAPAKKARRSRSGKSVDEIRALLEGVLASRKAGKTQGVAVKEAGISMSTYKYWLKKYSAAGAGKTVSAKKATVSAGKKISPLSILQEMTENRKKRQELEQAEKQIRELDARYEELRKRL
jgi:hypothetical protein